MKSIWIWFVFCSALVSLYRPTGGELRGRTNRDKHVVLKLKSFPVSDNFSAERRLGRRVGELSTHTMSTNIGFRRFKRARTDQRYCRTRRDAFTGRQLPCCRGRDDECALPFYDTECYCDEFCYRNRDSDCCPDYIQYCFDVGFGTTTIATTTERTTTESLTLPTTSTTKPFTTTTESLEVKVCYYNGKGYRLGETITVNCNKCLCQQVVNGYFNFQCQNNDCLIHPNLIEAINEGEYGWTAGNYSFFWGLTTGEGFSYRLGTQRAPEFIRKMSGVRAHFNELLPESFDSRTVWRDYILPPRDQGNCGSSWAFSTTSVASDRLAIQSNGLFKVDLSPQHLMSCHYYSNQAKCEGERVDRAWWFLRRKGVVSSECYPYVSDVNNNTEICDLSWNGGGSCPSGKSRLQVYKTGPLYKILNSERDIMKEIRDNGPVQATISVTRDFFLYKKGVYSPLPESFEKNGYGNTESYHSVKIVGWGVETEVFKFPVKYWIVQNSWGKDWGENGYFRIEKGVDASEVESMVLAAWAKVDTLVK